MKISLFIVSLSFIILTASAQNQFKADSIQEIIESSNLAGKEKLKAYYKFLTYSSSPEQIIKYGKELLDLSRKANNLSFELKANHWIGIGHRLMGNLGEALEYQFECANKAESNEEFLPYLVKVYSEISICYTQNGDSKNALLFGSKGIDILRKTGNKKGLGISLMNTGYDYYLIQNYDSAISYYNEAEPILEEIGLTIGQAYIIGNRALIFWKQGEVEKAKIDLSRAIEMLEPLGDTYGIADYYNQLGGIYLQQENYNRVIEFASKSYEIATEEEFKEQTRDASNLLYQAHLRQSNFQKAVEFQTKYHAYKDSIQNLETTQRLADLRTEYEVGRKQAEINLLLEQKRNNQIIIITGGIILLITIVLVITIYANYRSKTRLNRQLESQKSSLITLNQTKDKFFSIISHDLRGPVGTLIGLVEVMKYFVKEGKRENILEMVDNMGVLVNRVNKLLENLLSWALQQSGHFPYVPEDISIKTLVNEVMEMSKNTAISKSITLENDISEEFTLLIDRNATLTILRNLVNNGIKFTPEGGKVEIKTKLDKTNNYGVIQVIDNGVGIPEEKLKTLFKLNEKISTPGTSGESGIGLGLQLVFDFVKLNKGKLEVQSEVGKGSNFMVYLPLSDS